MPRNEEADEVLEAELRELHHFEVEQQLAETLAAVEHARSEVDGTEWTDDSWRHQRQTVAGILSTIKRDIPTGEVRPRGPVTDAGVRRVQHDLGQRFHGLSYRERLIVRAALESEARS